MVRGLNSKEKQHQLNRLLLVAAWFSIPRDLVDTLFVNHRYNQYHLSSLSANSLIMWAPVLAWIAHASGRWLQKLSAVVFALCCVAAFYTRLLSLDSPDHRHLLKMLIAIWVVAFLVFLVDWFLLQRRQTVSPSVPIKLPALDVFECSIDSREDHARWQIFNLLRDQAASEGFRLAEIDYRMIDYSRIAAPSVAKSVEQTFHATRDYWTFKGEIIRLLAKGIREDAERDPAAIKNYKKLKQDLRAGHRDQQLLAYLSPAILESRSQVRKATELMIYACIGCLAVALVFLTARYLI